MSAPTSARPGPTAPSRPAAQGRFKGQVPGLARLDSPLTTYYALLGATLLLLVIGLVMVLSASSVTSYKQTGSSFTVFKSQLVFALAGVVPMFLASRTPIRVWQRFAWRESPAKKIDETHAGESGEGLMEALAVHPGGGHFVMSGRS